jgi:hypothetical protein
MTKRYVAIIKPKAGVHWTEMTCSLRGKNDDAAIKEMVEALIEIKGQWKEMNIYRIGFWGTRTLIKSFTDGKILCVV